MPLGPRYLALVLCVALTACGGGAPSSTASVPQVPSQAVPTANPPAAGGTVVQPTFAPGTPSGPILSSAINVAPAGSFNTTATADGQTATAACANPSDTSTARCFAYVVNKGFATTTPNAVALAPSQLQSAYGFTSLAGSAGGGLTVAVVDAYDAPNIQADLNTYRSQYGLGAKTITIVCQQGTGTSTFSASTTDCTPTSIAGKAAQLAWTTETALDVDMVSALCPNCSILLVEGATAAVQDLAKSTLYAATTGGAKYVSNSYGSAESSADLTVDANDYAVAAASAVVLAATGDHGFAGGVSYPASSTSVIAVGGTLLAPAASTMRGFTEASWSGAGSGCSLYFRRQSFQNTAVCGAQRALADVSADAGYPLNICNSGTGSATATCWALVGGTSAATPIVASLYALADTSTGVVSAATASTPVQSVLYTRPDGLNDIINGHDNGVCGSVLCDPTLGYDGVTGVGSPYGIIALSPSTADPWTTVPFIRGLYLLDLAVGGTTPVLYAVANNNRLYQYVAANWTLSAATSGVAHVAIDPISGNPWVVTTSGLVYRASTSNISTQSWSQVQVAQAAVSTTITPLSGVTPTVSTIAFVNNAGTTVPYAVDTAGNFYSYSATDGFMLEMATQPSGGCCTSSTTTLLAGDPNAGAGFGLWVLSSAQQIYGPTGLSALGLLTVGTAVGLQIGPASTAYAVGPDDNLYTTTTTSGAAAWTFVRGSVSRVAVDGYSGSSCAGRIWILRDNNGSTLYVNNADRCP